MRSSRASLSSSKGHKSINGASKNRAVIGKPVPKPTPVTDDDLCDALKPIPPAKRNRQEQVGKKVKGMPKNEKPSVAVSAVMKQYEEGLSMYDIGHAEEAKQHLLGAVNQLAKEGENVPFLQASIQLALGNAHFALGEDESALQLYHRVLEVLEGQYGAHDPALVGVLVNIGLVHCNHARWREAMAAFQRARRLCESVLATAESERLQAADLYHNIGFVYDCQQNLTEALLMYEKAKTIRERILGTSHVVTALTYNNIAQILRDQKRWRESLCLHERVLSIRLSALGESHADTAESYHNIAHVQLLMRRLKDAERNCLLALSIRRQALGSSHPHTMASAELLAMVRRSY